MSEPKETGPVVAKAENLPGLIRYFARTYPREGAVMCMLILLSGLIEGVGLAMFVPLLEMLGDKNVSDPSRFSVVIIQGIEFLGLQPTLVTLLACVVVAISLKGLFYWLAMVRVGYTVADIATAFRLEVIANAITAGWSFYIRHPIGHFSNSVSSECTRASMAYLNLNTCTATVVQVCVYIGLAFAVSWQLALLIVFAVAVLGFVLRPFIVMSRRSGKRQTRFMKQLSARLIDTLQGIKPIKVMGREHLIRPFLERQATRLRDAQRERLLAQYSVASIYEPLTALVMAIGLFVAQSHYEIPLEELLFLAFIFSRAVMSSNGVIGAYQKLCTYESAFWSIRERIAEGVNEVERPDDGKEFTTLRSSIVLENVDFAYGDTSVLRNVSCEFPRGEFISLSGPSGSGKTTVTDLVAGLIKPVAGRILIDGEPLDAFSVRSWRRHIGYVPQEVFLLNDSIMNNITFGAEDISADEVLEALSKSGLTEYVNGLKDGILSEVGERGAKLSGGQRQRISIARALIRKPDLLILDEVTTALDPDTEAAIISTLKDLSGETTIISVSHQPAMVAAADRIFEVKGGGITLRAETGGEAS